MEKKLPSEWEKELGVTILDPDGWDRTNFEEDWAIPLTKDEFLKKMWYSTIRTPYVIDRGDGTFDISQIGGKQNPTIPRKLRDESKN